MGGNPQGWSFDNSGVVQLVRSAERLVATNNFRLALEQLSVAQTLDPKNAYISAIIERVQQLQVSAQSSRTASRNQLSVSFGTFPTNGLSDSLSDVPLSPKDLQVRVKQLTNIAEKYLEEGSPDKAFDSLMRAFMLDPTSPYVVACEKAVLPVWEQNQAKAGSAENLINTKRGQRTMTSQNPPLLDPTPSPLPEPLKSRLEQEQRLDTLRQKKEAERQEKERALWREASSPPKIYDSTQETNDPETSTELPEDPTKEKGGLFTKLRRGKFLG